MKFNDDEWYHVYNRGINSQMIFFTEENYLYFLRKLRKCFQVHADIIAYCLMPNHFHILVHTDSQILQTKPSLNQKIGNMLSSYTRAINRQENRSGSLFQAGTKAKLLTSSRTDNYPLICFHYIHQNPLRAGLVSQLEDWPYSSYPDYAEIRSGTLPNVKKGFEAFDFKNHEDFRKSSRNMIADHHIKHLYG